MKIHEYNEMMSYLTRPPAKVQTASLMDEYLGDQLDYQKAVEEGFAIIFPESRSAFGSTLKNLQVSFRSKGIRPGKSNLIHFSENKL